MRNNFVNITKVMLFLIVVLMLALLTYAIPNSLTLQGKLTNLAGASQQGTFTFRFRIYDVPNFTYYNVTQNATFPNGSVSGEINVTYINYTNILWEQNQSVTTDANGVYDVILGGINLSFADQYYLGITIGTDNESIPRINLTSAPYSFRANISEDLNANNSYIVTNLSIRGNATIGTGDTTLEISTQTFNLTKNGNINLANNITLGDRITFRFGQIIDNLISGFLRISGNLNVTGNTSIAQDTLFVDNTSSRVGIGTTTPYNTLTVIGSVGVSGSLNASSINTTGGAYFATSSGNVGVGNSVPSDKLHVLGSTRLVVNDTNNVSTTNVLTLDHFIQNPLNSTGGIGVGILIRAIDNGSNVDDVALINATLVTSLNGSEASAIGFYTRTAGGLLAPRLFINGSKVGINTTTPNQVLTVVGNANITGDVNITGSLDVRGSSITLGDATSDTVQVIAQVASDLIPNNNDRDLGSGANFWRRGYIDILTVNNLSAGDTNISGTTSPTFTINSNYTGNDDRDVDLVFERGTPVINAVLKWDSTNKRFDMNFPLFIQANNNLTVDTNTLFVDGSINRVGIGTTTPTHTLTVIGDINATGAVFAAAVNITSGGLNLLQGSLGVNTSSPAQTLTVQGTLNVTANPTRSGDLFVASGGNVGIGTTSPYNTLTVVGSVGVSGSLNASSINTTGGAYFATSSGNVGIGTTTPDNKLTIAGTDADANLATIGLLHLNITDSYNKSVTNLITLDHNLNNPANSTGGIGLGILFRAINNDSELVNVSFINATLVNAINGSEASALTFYTRSGNAGLVPKLILNGTDVYINPTTGKLGIGTTSPVDTLTIVGSVSTFGSLNATNINATTITVTNLNLPASSNSSLWNRSSTNTMLRFNDDNVGIGTSIPAAKLHVNTTTTATADFTNIKSGIVYNSEFAMTNWYGAYISAPAGTGTITNKYALVTEPNAGNVGINTTTPSSTLQVAGTANITSASTQFLVNSNGNVIINLKG